MRNIFQEKVTWVHHWNERLFSFRTTRDPNYRFKNGQFTMIGIESDGKPLMRAYSFVSANYEEEFEFFSIKVPDGSLTSRLQHLKIGDTVLVNTKPTGTLILDRLLPAKRLYLISTGTGIAPFMSIIKDPETYEVFDKVILAHGVRSVVDLAYEDYILHQLPNHEFLGEMILKQLIYYPTVTREPFANEGRLTDKFDSGEFFADLGFPAATIKDDRVMICGSMPFTKLMTKLLVDRGFIESRRGEQAHFVTERAFVEQHK